MTGRHELCPGKGIRGFYPHTYPQPDVHKRKYRNALNPLGGIPGTGVENSDVSSRHFALDAA